MEPREALERVAFLLERNLAEPYKVKAFRSAANAIRPFSHEEMQQRAKTNRIRSLAGVGATSEAIILQALEGKVPDYLAKLEAEPWLGTEFNVESELLKTLKGDCHTHSDWSDGGSPIEEMGRAARDLGHEYIVLTDHSPNLTVANGLTAERLQQQWLEVDAANEKLKPFRILKGIEVDILEDGTLDQTEEMLGQLDVVVASVHSALRSESTVMTKRMLAAIADPRTNILGHCTGRKVVGRGRPPSAFDAKAVFEACVEYDVAVEINSRPERKDPPMELLKLAAEIGCRFSIDSDSHAPGQLTWLPIGAERAERAGITADRIVNAQKADDLVAWARS